MLKQEMYALKESDLEFKVGEKVWFYSPNSKMGKFDIPWKCSTINEKISKYNYRLNLNRRGRTNVFHLNRLRRYNPSGDNEEDNSEDESENEGSDRGFEEKEDA